MSGAESEQLRQENEKLKKDLEDLQKKREQDIAHYEQKVDKERSAGRAYSEQAEQKANELSSMKNKMVKLTRQLDEEVTRRDIAQSETQTLQCKVQDLADGAPMPSPSTTKSQTKGISFESRSGGKQEEQAPVNQASSQQGSTKIMRVIHHWMENKDCTQAMLRGASINDLAFSTMVQLLADCQSLQTLDLCQNQLTMDSCSEICNLITNSSSLSYISLAENNLSMRSLGYFMTAIMERQNTKKLAPLDLLELQGNEGFLAAAAAPAPENLVRQVNAALGPIKLPPRGAELIAQVMRCIWRFLHDTGHPQVRNSNVDEVDFGSMDKSTVRKMESALMKILILAGDEEGDSRGHDGHGAVRAVTADLIFVTLQDQPTQEIRMETVKDVGGARQPAAEQTQQAVPHENRRPLGHGDHQGAASRPELRDPFSDLKAAFEPPKEKLKTFNLKQIVTRNGTVLMNMLERLLETTEIDAHDVETEQTLLEYACQTGNVGLAKLCYRRGANLSARTKKGDTAFNIVTKNKRYDLMEFLHKYGVRVNSSDAEGLTALHIAATNDDVDGVCRLIEWGADVNIRDNKKRTPLHSSAAGGHFGVTMLLLEVGAEMNAKDEKEYTPAAWAEACNHFALMDRLVMLGGKGHGLSQKDKNTTASKNAKGLGELNVSPQMLKSSSLGRIGKVKVAGLPEPLRASLTK